MPTGGLMQYTNQGNEKNWGCNMSEIELMKEIQTLWSQTQGRLFRNNIGMGWTGQRVTVTRTQSVVVGPGDVLLRNARPFHAGLCEGSSDLIGWKSILITPEMVGKPFAQFAAVETKSPKGRATDEQRQFLHVVDSVGGFSVLAKKIEDAIR